MGWSWYIHNETRDLYYCLGGDTSCIQRDLKRVFTVLQWSFDDVISIINDEGRVIDWSKVVNF